MKMIWKTSGISFRLFGEELSLLLRNSGEACRKSFKTCSACSLNKKKSITKSSFLSERRNWENDLLYGPPIKKSKEIKSSPKTKKNTNNQTINNKDINFYKLEETPLTKSEVQNEPSESYNISFPLFFNFDENSTGTNNMNEKLAALAKTVVLTDVNSSSPTRYEPSVTNILQRTMSPESAAILERWRLKMIESLGLEGFAKYQQETFQRGNLLHQKIRDFLKNDDSVDESTIDGVDSYWKSITEVLKEVSDVVTLEQKITHPYLCYRGITDCIAKFRNEKVLIEWKTSEKPKPSLSHTYDSPLQVAAYIGAFNAIQSCLVDQLDHGLVVIAYADGSPAHAHIMSKSICQESWNLWLLRLQQYWKFQRCLKMKES